MRRILFYANNGNSNPALRLALQHQAFEVDESRSLITVRRMLSERGYAVVVSACAKLDRNQMELLRYLRSVGSQTPIVIASQEGPTSEAAYFLEAGASEVLFQPGLEQATIDAVRSRIPAESRVEESRTEDGKTTPPGPEPTGGIALIGESPAIRDVRSAIDLVAYSSTAVLITGESGTGKEVVARSIHLKSPRKDKPFVGLNCAALPRDVIENELFGHERGAFTGALTKKIGSFDLADGGTLFFDEIAEMNVETQAKLLRAIELKAFRRLGGEKEVNVDVRTVAATNKVIAEALRSGELRQDLYYRFSVIEIFIPPLRERAVDIPPLVDHFVKEFSEKYNKSIEGLDESAMHALLNCEWPGNVRQLRNAIERAVVTCAKPRLTADDLPPSMVGRVAERKTVSIPIGVSLEQAERLFIEKTLERTGFNKSRAAHLLQISRKTLHRKIADFRALADEHDLVDGQEGLAAKTDEIHAARE